MQDREMKVYTIRIQKIHEALWDTIILLVFWIFQQLHDPYLACHKLKYQLYHHHHHHQVKCMYCQSKHYIIYLVVLFTRHCQQYVLHKIGYFSLQYYYVKYHLKNFSIVTIFYFDLHSHQFNCVIYINRHNW